MIEPDQRLEACSRVWRACDSRQSRLTCAAAKPRRVRRAGTGKSVCCLSIIGGRARGGYRRVLAKYDRTDRGRGQEHPPPWLSPVPERRLVFDPHRAECRGADPRNFPFICPRCSTRSRLQIAMGGCPPRRTQISSTVRRNDLGAGVARALALDPEPCSATIRLRGSTQSPRGGRPKSCRFRTLASPSPITHDPTHCTRCDRVAVLAEKHVIGVGTIPELLALDHPWIQEYFNGPRGRNAGASYKHEGAVA